MLDISQKNFEEFITASHRVAAYSLVRCSSGNLSWRVDDKHMLISASGTWLADIIKDQVAVCRISDGTPLNDKKPSAEIGFHTGILRERSDMNVVLHFQSPFATALACRSPETMNCFVIPEIPYYIGPVAVVPYMHPGSEDLAEAVISAMKDHDLVLMCNHGQVTVGKNFNDAIQKAVFFELACEIILKSGGQTRIISEYPDDIRKLHESNI
ncbi:MAG: class II aldolase/adducin family protein [Thermodesulfobacteriota bacterium]|nr:class II aldolase/adducin family protein [Thermodesulfobacteriota bacterium]